MLRTTWELWSNMSFSYYVIPDLMKMLDIKTECEGTSGGFSHTAEMLFPLLRFLICCLYFHICMVSVYEINRQVYLFTMKYPWRIKERGVQKKGYIFLLCHIGINYTVCCSNLTLDCRSSTFAWTHQELKQPICYLLDAWVGHTRVMIHPIKGPGN